MIPALRRLVVAFLLAALLVPAALPVVTADHVYSHRYVVYGRLVDANGDPIPQAVVNVEMPESTGVEGLCGDQPDTETEAWGKTTTRRQTNEYGEFFYCFHVHSISRGARGDIVASYEGAEAKVPIDPFYRKNFVLLQTSDESGTPSEDFSSTYLVSGRAWYDKTARLEGVSVYGRTLDYANVTITFTTADGQKITEESTTNGYGDFAVRVPVEEAAGGKITVEVGGKTFTADANPQARASEIKLEVPDPDNPVGTVLKVMGGIVAAGLVVGGGAFAWKKASEKRELSIARENSTRKRANR